MTLLIPHLYKYMDIDAIFNIWEYWQTQRKSEGRSSKNDRKKIFARSTRNFIYEKKREIRNDIKEVLKRFRVTNSRVNIIVTWRIIVVFQRNVFSWTSFLSDAHRTLLFTQECKHIWEDPWESYFIFYLCVIYTYVP